MPRVNKNKVISIIKFLRAHGFDIDVEYMMGRPRCTSLGGSRDISPRLTNREMLLWLEGFSACLWEQDIHKQKQTNSLTESDNSSKISLSPGESKA